MALKSHGKREWLVQIEGIQTRFSKFSAPKVTRSKTEYSDTEKGLMRTHLGFSKNEPVTLSKNYDPVADTQLIDWIKEQQATPRRFTVTLTPVESNIAGTVIAGARSIQLVNCQLGDVTYPDGDRDDGSGLTKFELEIIADDLPVSQ